MKQLLFYTGLSIILVAAFSSCSSEVETTSSFNKFMKKMLMSYLVNMLLYTKIWSEQFLRNVKKFQYPNLILI